MPDSALRPMSALNLVGLILARVIVPLWVLTGAVFKLAKKTPTLLPENIWRGADDLQINLYWLLAALIAIELILVGVMFFLPKLARLAALFITGVFCIVLIGELAAGHTSCGCLGAYSPSPWIMLAIDGALFLGLLIFTPPRVAGPAFPSGQATVFAMWVLAALSFSAAFILPESAPPAADTTTNPQPATAENNSNGAKVPDVVVNPPPTKTARRPASYIPKTDAWIGKRISEIELSQWVNGWPADINTGPYYVIFYSRTCDHCQLLVNTFFASPPPAPTIIVAVPETKQGFATKGLLEHHCEGCLELELPVGTDWMMTPPLVIALQDGVVQCAAEGVDASEDTPKCLIWH